MLSSTRTATRFGLAAAVLLLAGSLASAEGIPPSALEADQKSCISACIGAGKEPEKCAAFCSCSAKAYGEQLTIEEYLAINNAISKNEVPPEEAVAKMKAITRSCKAEIE